MYRSLSARRAWIEIPAALARTASCTVALRKESVDRNLLAAMELLPRLVALRKESVDRNNDSAAILNRANASLSARRAWIEIAPKTAKNGITKVALRKESVDRNLMSPFT